MSPASTRTATRQERSTRSVDGILNAAAELIGAEGIAGTSMSDIANRAQVSVGRVYYWFESKDAIVRALQARTHEVIEEFFAAIVVDDPSISTPELITGIVDATTGLARSHPDVLALLDAPRDGDEPSLRSSVLSRVADLVHVRVSTCPAEEARVVAAMIVNSVVGALRSIVTERDDPAAVRTETIYLISAYLACRFPAAENPHEVVAPSRSANRTVRPPDSPLAPFCGR